MNRTLYLNMYQKAFIYILLLICNGEKGKTTFIWCERKIKMNFGFITFAQQIYRYRYRYINTLTSLAAFSIGSS